MEVSSSKLYVHLIKRTNGGNWLAFLVLVPMLLSTLHDLHRGLSPMVSSFSAVVSPSDPGFKQVVSHMIDPIGCVSRRAQ